MLFSIEIFRLAAITQAKISMIVSPVITEIRTADVIDKKKNGITKIKENINFPMNVKILISQIFESIFSSSLDSSERCIPNASDSESAIAIVRIAAITAVFEDVA